MSFTVTKKDEKWQALLKRVKELKGRQSFAKAGIIGTRAGEEHAGKSASEHLTNVRLALIHEFGAPEQGIPERSFVRSAFHEHREAYRELLVKLVKDGVLEGKMSLEKALGLLGQKMASDMKGKFTKNDWPPNTPETISAKGSSRPLIDTGALRASITYEVVMKGEK
jgi:hypothetical protein